MDYVIVGAGPAGVIAAETLAKTGSGSVTLVGSEPEAPYSRMALPYLLAEDIGEEGTHLRHGDGHYEGLGITVRQGTVASIAPAATSITLDGGDTLNY
ncbi:MAG: FAD-dependent oxidoreductase, partial [Alphaproteobacteria bacterium]